MTDVRNKRPFGPILALLACDTRRDIAALMKPHHRFDKILITHDFELLPLKALFENYLYAHASNNTNTARAKINDLSKFAEFLDRVLGAFDSLTLADLTEDIIRAFLSYANTNGEAPETIRRRVSTIKHFARALKSRLHDWHNPAAAIRPPQVIKRRAQDLSLEQLEALREVILEAPLRDRLLVEMLLQTGLRESEVLDLNIFHLSHDHALFIAVKRKGNRYEDVLIPDDLKTLLEQYLPIRDGQLSARVHNWGLLTDADKKRYPLIISCWRTKPETPNDYRLSPKTAWRIIREACLRTGIIPLELSHPHVLRHTAAQMIYDATHDLDLTATFAGHTNPKTTRDYYVRTQKDRLAQAAKVLARRAPRKP